MCISESCSKKSQTLSLKILEMSHFAHDVLLPYSRFWYRKSVHRWKSSLHPCEWLNGPTVGQGHCSSLLRGKLLCGAGVTCCFGRLGCKLLWRDASSFPLLRQTGLFSLAHLRSLAYERGKELLCAPGASLCHVDQLLTVSDCREGGEVSPRSWWGKWIPLWEQEPQQGSGFPRSASQEEDLMVGSGCSAPACSQSLWESTRSGQVPV